ncbi:MAG: hypothetical protein A4E45_00197 [Methanosaeta sp. PtaB.Bin039]|nr:MAG: hypothetical protein A4E45_00197 [Methanosaeta sp. PtaB.Bin039]OPY45692.1 MAG: hypothetical protein A4E47_00878 [Methanosaeta sp. PtaU1.Bin028]HOT07359.1 winged helix-turn-helix transcriptional regulator [Methanotrichaceae archaeon]HQF17361.1 winged helix-turn-helix transcriptional regulator [Methanotrichaceae archaeon]HQI91978.1 winged helix-turn-helix transcriptional regulator [Methanotrichaceae archaeon]
MLTENVVSELEMLKRHLIILRCVVENEPIGILKLAEVTGIPGHKVRYSLRVLEQEGLIAASAPGAITTKATQPFLEKVDCLIDDLIRTAEDLQLKDPAK